ETKARHVDNGCLPEWRDRDGSQVVLLFERAPAEPRPAQDVRGAGEVDPVDHLVAAVGGAIVLGYQQLGRAERREVAHLDPILLRYAGLLRRRGLVNEDAVEARDRP